MGECEYGKGENKVEYYDYENKRFIPYECPRDSLPDKHYCKFHDSDYAQANPDDVMKSFYTLVDEAVQNIKPLFCIGFYLPMEVNLTSREFKDRVYFSQSIFTERADFSSAAFTKEANFYGAAFTKEANFSHAAFTKEAIFYGATFTERADFYGAAFTKEADFYGAAFTKEAIFYGTAFTERADFSSAAFTKEANFSHAAFTKEAYFSYSDFIDEVAFDKSRFPSPKTGKDSKDNRALIRFDYSTFRKRVQFIGDAENKQLLDLGLVSFKGVDLSNVEFHNVRWLKTKSLVTRNKIIDEQLLDNGNTNYEEVSKIYNQLRKNYESKLLFNEASNFFIGEMEAIRKSLWNARTIREKMASIPYSLYKGLALYGESYFLPLIIWTPVTILTFIFLRHYFGVCSVPHSPCNIMDQAVDSFASYFQFPRSATNTLDTVERILSIPMLGTAFIAIRRKFERVK